VQSAKARVLALRRERSVPLQTQDRSAAGESDHSIGAADAKSTEIEIEHAISMRFLRQKWLKKRMDIA
jgi:hypothetical protein